MESLDDVIDAMIADHVIHRHGRKWLALLGLIVVLALVITLTGGWKAKAKQSVERVDAPYTVDGGRFEYAVRSAKIVNRPKSEYQEAETRVEVAVDVRNIDTETRTSDSPASNLLVLVLPKGKGEVDSKGLSCRDEIGYDHVYGLPAVSCVAKYEVPVGYKASTLELGIVGEKFEASTSKIATDEPYWQEDEPLIVVRVPATVETEDK